jgi:putative transposase
MKRSKFTDEQILAIVKEGEAGRKVADLCRANGITEQTYYRWKAKHGGMELSEMQRLKQLEDENRRLKHIVAEQTLARLSAAAHHSMIRRRLQFGRPTLHPDALSLNVRPLPCRTEDHSPCPSTRLVG